jgi:hypothetical protein
MIDHFPPPKLWAPTKPAIIRAASIEEIDRTNRKASFLPGMNPGAFAVSSLATDVAFINSASSTANATTYDFGNFTAPSAGLMVVIAAASGAAGAAISSISIGGTNGQLHISNVDLGIGSREVSAGAQNVTVAWSASRTQAGCSVYFITKYRQRAPWHIRNGSFVAGVTQEQIALNIPVRGVAIFGNMHSGTAVSAWSSATENLDLTIESAIKFTTAMKTSLGDIDGHVETVSWTGTQNSESAGVSWR